MHYRFHWRLYNFYDNESAVKARNCQICYIALGPIFFFRSSHESAWVSCWTGLEDLRSFRGLKKCSFLFQRILVLTQRLNSTLLHKFCFGWLPGLMVIVFPFHFFIANFDIFGFFLTVNNDINNNVSEQQCRRRRRTHQRRHQQARVQVLAPPLNAQRHVVQCHVVHKVTWCNITWCRSWQRQWSTSGVTVTYTLCWCSGQQQQQQPGNDNDDGQWWRVRHGRHDGEPAQDFRRHLRRQRLADSTLLRRSTCRRRICCKTQCQKTVYNKSTTNGKSGVYAPYHAHRG